MQEQKGFKQIKRSKAPPMSDMPERKTVDYNRPDPGTAKDTYLGKSSYTADSIQFFFI